MATNKYSNQFIIELYHSEHDLEADTLIAILMGPTFVFDPATHATYADVSADEIATGNGYTQNTKQLTTVAMTAAAPIEATADDVTWMASTGQIGPAAALIIYNSSHANNTVVCCIEFGGAYYAPDGDPFTVGLSAGFLGASPNTAPVAGTTEADMTTLLAHLVNNEGYTETEFDDWYTAQKTEHWGGAA